MEGLLSPFKLSCKGSPPQNLPWSEVHFALPSRNPELVIRPECCGGCLSPECAACVRAVEAGSVRVVKCRSGKRTAYLFYIVFSDDSNTPSAMQLAPITRALAGQVVPAMITRQRCPCGDCDHPLLGVSPAPDDQRAELERELYHHTRSRIKLITTKHVSDGRLCKRPRNTLLEEKIGDCSICLEESIQISTRECPHERCSLPICVDCREKMRGLCPLCDRTKATMLFVCHSCHEPVQLTRFGHECIGCSTPNICRSCYTAYEMCSSCCDEASQPQPGKAQRATVP